jgi:catechol 2,3-dioxygenase-like lactoylglutathione lyase family enzyme
MQFHQGRLIDHIHLRVSDIEASRRFYRAVLEAIGTGFTSESPRHFSCDELWVDQADGPVSRVHLAFQASDVATVQAFHAAALANGGRDNGAPGSGLIILAITALSRWIRTATTSKRCSMARRSARLHR